MDIQWGSADGAGGQASADKQKTVEVGAELFVGNLDSMVDEKTLYDTFSSFGNLVSAPKVRVLFPPCPGFARSLIRNIDCA